MSGQLFDADRTTETACTVCGATRLPGHDKADGCWIDEQHAMGEYEKRPRDCLNTFDPRHQTFPEGY